MDTEKLLSFCQDLIRLKSLSGNEQLVAERIVREMNHLGYDEVTLDPYGNVIGKINGNGKRSILFEGHMDIVDVPTPEKWSVDPFGAVIQDGRLYGRGASDMKTAMAAMVYGAADCIGHEDKADVYVVAVVHEEIFEGVGFGKVLDFIHPDVVVLGEPNDLEIAIGQKGRAEIVLETIGVNAHSANPGKGVNAIDHMVLLMNEVNRLAVLESKILGKGILVATDIISSPYPGTSIIPNHCRVTFDRRLIEDETRESVLAPFLEVVDSLSKKVDALSAKVSFAVEKLYTYTGETLESERFYPGWTLDKDNELVLLARKIYNTLRIEPMIKTYQFCTDGSECAGKRNIPTIGIGPGRADMAHVVDENIEIEKIVTAAKIYSCLAKEY